MIASSIAVITISASLILLYVAYNNRINTLTEENTNLKQTLENKEAEQKLNDKFSDWKTATDEKYGFSIKYPEDLTYKVGKGLSTMGYIAAYNNALYINIFATKSSKTYDACYKGPIPDSEWNPEDGPNTTAGDVITKSIVNGLQACTIKPWQAIVGPEEYTMLIKNEKNGYYYEISYVLNDLEHIDNGIEGLPLAEINQTVLDIVSTFKVLDK